MLRACDNSSAYGVLYWVVDTKQIRAVFLFLYFIFLFFYKNIFSCLKFTWIYSGRSAAGLPGPGRPAAGRQGLICIKTRQKIAPRSLENRPPGSGAAGPVRPPAGRPAPQPYISCWLPLTPSFASLKIQKKEKRGREGETKRRRPAGFSSRRL